MSEPQIEVTGASRRFVRRDRSDVRALDDVSFAVEPGEFLVLLGPSGCGKSTLLRSLAGLEELDAGRIALGGRVVVDTARRIQVPTEDRRLSMMFQSYALWPHMTVTANVAYPLRARGMRKAAVAERVRAVLESVGIPELAGQYPGQISGGQAQRVALARALVSQDGIVLFDEPLSNVDAKVRVRLRTEIARLHRESGFTAVYVTHDQEEALTLATRICVMRAGRIQQSGSPQDIYDRPNSRYVAQFMGSVNELTARFDGSRSGRLCRVDTPIGQTMIDYPSGRAGELTVFSRPEAWRFAPVDGAPSGTAWSVSGTVTEVVFLGSVTDTRVSVEGAEVTVRSMDRHHRPGDRVRLEIDHGSLVGRAGGDESDLDDDAGADGAAAASELVGVATAEGSR